MPRCSIRPSDARAVFRFMTSFGIPKEGNAVAGIPCRSQGAFQFCPSDHGSIHALDKVFKFRIILQAGGRELTVRHHAQCSYKELWKLRDWCCTYLAGDLNFPDLPSSLAKLMPPTINKKINEYRITRIHTHVCRFFPHTSRYDQPHLRKRRIDYGIPYFGARNSLSLTNKIGNEYGSFP